jgi:hypothetical protein
MKEKRIEKSKSGEGTKDIEKFIKKKEQENNLLEKLLDHLTPINKNNQDKQK